MNAGMRHLHMRKRSQTASAPYPHAERYKKFLDYLMYTAAVLAPLVILPQVAQIFSLKNAAGLSLITWTLMTAGNLMWALYGFVHKERLILFANLFTALLNSLVILGIVLYA